jgi:hypothetical protein
VGHFAGYSPGNRSGSLTGPGQVILIRRITYLGPMSPNKEVWN